MDTGGTPVRPHSAGFAGMLDMMDMAGTPTATPIMDVDLDLRDSGEQTYLSLSQDSVTNRGPDRYCGHKARGVGILKARRRSSSLERTSTTSLQGSTANFSDWSYHRLQQQQHYVSQSKISISSNSPAAGRKETPGMHEPIQSAPVTTTFL